MAGDRILPGFQLTPEEQLYRVHVGADPAAGAEISITVPGEAAWDLICVSFVFTSDATVQNRRVQLLIDDGTNVLLATSTEENQDASRVVRYTAGRFGLEVAEAFRGLIVMPLPPIVLLPGFRIRTSTHQGQAGDDYGAPVVYAREVRRRGDTAAILAAARAIASSFEEVGAGV